MIDCPAPTSHSRRCIDRRIAIAGCHVDFSIDFSAEGGGVSGEAARLAEDLVAARIGCERRLIRVAALMPSGRPVAMVRGRSAALSVSVSHIGSMIAAAVCGTADVGIDIVDPAEAGRSLDVWFTPDELALLPDEDGLLRARLWGAKEAAFKAACIDDGFRPCSVEIDHLGCTGFRWSVRGEHGPVCGQGIFTVAGMHLVAIAVAADHEAADGWAPSAAEVVACS
jgi:hypothetical protein